MSVHGLSTWLRTQPNVLESCKKQQHAALRMPSCHQPNPLSRLKGYSDPIGEAGRRPTNSWRNLQQGSIGNDDKDVDSKTGVLSEHRFEVPCSSPNVDPSQKPTNVTNYNSDWPGANRTWHLGLVSLLVPSQGWHCNMKQVNRPLQV